jgi:hypothetical protein
LTVNWMMESQAKVKSGYNRGRAPQHLTEQPIQLITT